MVDFSTVTEFEKRVADFFGAPYGIAVDSCTHGIELCYRYTGAEYMLCPKHTYLSIPMLADKLNLERSWINSEWKDWYYLTSSIIDGAVKWEKNSYLMTSLTVISFQYQKHLSLGRGGMILTDDAKAAEELKKMSYDGRLHGIPWRKQNIKSLGYHYYMTPEMAAMGLQKLDEAIKAQPRQWTWKDYPDLTEMDIFKTT